MLGTFVNIFKIPDLRNKILFTAALLCIYRIGFYIPVPGFNQEAIAAQSQTKDTSSPLSRAEDSGDVQRRNAEPKQSLRSRYYALYFGVYYSDAARRGDAFA